MSKTTSVFLEEHCRIDRESWRTGSGQARRSSVGLQTVRDWVLRFNAVGPSGLVDGKAPGQTPKLNEAQREALAQMVESGPVPAAHGAVRWRLIDLVQWVWDEFGISIATQTMRRELRAMGYRKSSARPRHLGQARDAIPAFKKTSPPRWQRSKRCPSPSCRWLGTAATPIPDIEPPPCSRPASRSWRRVAPRETTAITARVV